MRHPVQNGFAEQRDEADCGRNTEMNTGEVQTEDAGDQRKWIIISRLIAHC
jgi:hypothetical protein